MPRYLLHIDPGDDERIRRLIRLGVYRDLDHIVSVAIRNQLIAEEQAVDPWPDRSEGTTPLAFVAKGPPSSNRANLGRDQLNSDGLESLVTLDPAKAPAIATAPSDTDLAGTIFWAQYYKNLPLKVAGRVLYSMTYERPVPLADYSRVTVDIAARLHQVLRNIDREFNLPPGKRLSTSFPEPLEKSKTRFSEQYLIDRRPRDGLLDGFLARSRFANLIEVDGELKVALTQAGVEFVRLPNPVLAEEPDHTRSLSAEEIEFLIGHLRERVPLEFNHMISFLEAVARGAKDRESLDGSMRRFYRSVLDGGERMTPEHISSMRAGVQSRLQEMNLIAIQRKGRSSRCRISERGSALLRSGPAILRSPGTSAETSTVQQDG